MTIVDMPVDAQNLVRLRRRKDLDELDYKRALRHVARSGYTQTQISKWLGIAQPSVLSALRTAEKLPDVVAGFSGADPYEICQRYAAGLIDRAQLVDELVRWDYAPEPTTDGYDWLAGDSTGTWENVARATTMGLIDDEIYEEIFNRLVAEDEAPG